VFWLCDAAAVRAPPNYLSLASQIAITALFALSLDLILGYAGIVSLGHAAFFGVGCVRRRVCSQALLERAVYRPAARGAARDPGRYAMSSLVRALPPLR
jgi:hypothetical protein